MVCKEDVLLWFKELHSYERIDVLYELLNMCIPFELRFLASCVEDIGRHTYQELRGPSLIANDIDKLTKDSSLSRNLSEASVRHRIIIYLSLLTSKNYSVATFLYKNHLRTEWIEEYILKGNVECETLISEFLLLYTMALHHPAFTFEHKLFFGTMVSRLIECRNSISQNQNSATPYRPPGFGYPHGKYKNVPDNTVPLKPGYIMPYTDLNNIQQSQHSLPLLAQPHPIDFMAPIWPRPAGITCGAPEMPPFPPPPPNMSPLVSQVETPNHSRNTSPHRTSVNVRPQAEPPSLLNPTPPPPPPGLDIIPIPVAAVPLDSLSHTGPHLYCVKNVPDDELPSDENTHLIETPWARAALPDQLKPLNGLVYPLYSSKIPVPYLEEQMKALRLEGENSLHHSNSSSNSSLNHSPPETPTALPNHLVAREENSRNNATSAAAPFVNTMPPLSDATPPPPSFSNCTVPYPTPLIPANRSLFPYTQFCRPPFNNTPYYHNTTDNTVPYNTVPYVSIMYSSPAAYPGRQQSCYNCGAAGHAGPDCTGQSIEDITQKWSYTLDIGATTGPQEEK